ncbi:MAG: exopolysaccharide Pel transporter PelG [Spirochaetes bacterium]|nr:exopolysaccharide Pel transporter PelG [Spirochaetota bacterium]
MAGIGFQLQKLIEDESFLKKAKAYIFASIITSGPWILSIICLGLIGLLSGTLITGMEFPKVSITIVYTFAFSLIFTGPVQYILTRYLADKEYIKQKDKMLSALITALIMSLAISLALSVPWYLSIEASLQFKVTGILLFATVCLIWTMMDFLSCSKNYTGIIYSFFTGSASSLILAVVFGKTSGVDGSLAGYTAGQFILLTALLFFIAKEFPYNGIFNREFLHYFTLFPFIFFTGFFYNMGLWIDKLIGWFFMGETVFGNFKAYGVYDTPVFIAYLSIIPSLAYFLIQSETRFFLVHRRFFDSISNEKLQNILQYKDDLIKVLSLSILRLFIIQFACSLGGFIFSGFIVSWFGLSVQSEEVLRILFFAAGAQVMFLYIIIFIMYFDLSKLGFYLVALFFLLNFMLNILNLFFPFAPMGSAYLISISVSFFAGLAFLLYSVSDIEYSIFMRQED